MGDLVVRLHEYSLDDHERGCQGRYYDCTCGYDAKRDPLLDEAIARIRQLEAENASLASWQCEFTDGKTGLVYGQGGSTFCIMAKRVEQLKKALQAVDDEHGYGLPPETRKMIHSALGKK